MALPFFFIPVRAPEASEQELNSFQSSHKILTIDRHFVDQGSSSFWALRIDHLTIVFTCFDAPVTQSCTVLGMQVARKRTEPSIRIFGDGGRQFEPTVSLRLRDPRGGTQPC